MEYRKVIHAVIFVLIVSFCVYFASNMALPSIERELMFSKSISLQTWAFNRLASKPFYSQNPEILRCIYSLAKTSEDHRVVLRAIRYLSIIDEKSKVIGLIDDLLLKNITNEYRENLIFYRGVLTNEGYQGQVSTNGAIAGTSQNATNDRRR